MCGLSNQRNICKVIKRNEFQINKRISNEILSHATMWMNPENILRHKSAHITGLHLHERYRIGKTRGIKWMGGCKGGREGLERELLLGTGCPSGVRKFLAGII